MAHRETAKLTIAEVCQEASVWPAPFFNWRKKFRAAECQPDPSSGLAAPIVPVRIVDDQVAKITLETPGGIRVCVRQGCDEATLQRVMRAVTQFRQPYVGVPMMSATQPPASPPRPS